MRPINVIRENDSLWSCLGDDPQFWIEFVFLRPRVCLFFLEAIDEPLDPVIYVDRGEGFDEADALSLDHSGSALFVVSLERPSFIRRIRFDPASRQSRFRFWTKSIYREAALPRVVDKVAKDANDSGLIPPVCIHVSLRGGQDARSHRSQVARSVGEHYRHTISLAANLPGVASTELPSDNIGPYLSLVVPTYNTKPEYLHDLLDSFRAQRSVNAEMVLADDGSTSSTTLNLLGEIGEVPKISYVPHERNTGIAEALNRGIATARGEWIGFIDHDDALAPHALDQVVSAMQRHPDAKFFYTDEVIADARLKPVGYILKPAFDPVLLSGVNYINHLSWFRRDRLVEIGGLRRGFEGSQDYDLLLRYLGGLAPHEIVHIPFPAYLWRRGPETYSTVFLERSLASARRALAEQYSKDYEDIEIAPALDQALHRPRFDTAIRKWPSVTVVIPSRDAFELISRVLQGLHDKTNYPDLEIVVIDNGSQDQRVLDLYEKYRNGPLRFRAIVESEAFNFSRQVNRGIRVARGQHVLLLNNDIEILDADWLREMVSCLAYPSVGIVGAMLLYPNKTIQHAGVVVGFGGLAGHWFERKPASFPGPFGRLRVRQSVSAVTGACMLISRECIERVGEFDEHRFAIAYNDVDFCLRAATHGLRTVWTPFAKFIHHESASRGSDELPRNKERFEREKAALRERHRTTSFADPAVSPWYTRDRSEPGLLLLEALPAPREGRL